MEKKDLETIYAALKGTKINELKIETDNLKFEISLHENQAEKNTPNNQNVIQNKKIENTIRDIPIALEEKKEQNPLDIYSEHIGFFTRFDPKTKKQSVKLRTSVKKGDIVGFIKSLHVNYPIISNKEGKVINFLVEEGQPIEYQQPIVRLEMIDEK